MSDSTNRFENDVEKPVIIDPSPVRDQAATGGRDLLILIGALPALVAILGTRDVKSIVDWLASEPGLVFVGAATAIVTTLYRQWLARRSKATLVTVARSASYSTAQVKVKDRSK